MSWFLAVLIAAAMAAVSVGSTYFWLRVARLPAFAAGVFAPAVTFAVLVALGYLYSALGIFWAGTTVIPVLAVIGSAGGFVFWKLSKRSARGTPPWGRLFWVMVLLGWILAVLPLVLSAPATNPVQQWDPSFHMNGVWSINHLGDGRMGSGLDSAFREGNSSEYPLGWHIFTALFTTPKTVVLGSNASSLALILLWVVGAAAYTRMLFGVRLASLAAPVLAGGMLSMPGDALMAYNQWPNATAVALLPGIAIVLLLLGRHVRDAIYGKVTISPLKLAGAAGGIIFALIGAVVVHPSIAFNLLVLLLPAVVAALYNAFRWFLGQRKYPLASVPVLLFAVGMFVLYLIMELPTVRSMGNYPRGGISWSLAFGSLITPTPPYPNSPSLFLWGGVLAGLLLAGIAGSYLRLSWWPPQGGYRPSLPTWPVWSFVFFAGLVFLSYGPNNPLRTWLVAPWYLDARRIMEPENLAMVPLAALGFAWLALGITRWLKNQGYAFSATNVSASVAAVLLVLSGGEGLGARTAAAASVYDPNSLGKPGMATAGELEMLQSLDDLLPPDAHILGDPQNGSVYAQMIGQREVFFPALTLSRNPTENESVLVQSFNQILTDPRVCQAVREEGLTHFYADDDGYYYSRLRSDRTPGLYNVDTTSGFELVATGDSARLYRITACD